MSDVEFYGAMVLAIILVWAGMEGLVWLTKPRRPFTAAAIKRHREDSAKVERIEAERARVSRIATLPRTHPLPPTFTTLGDAANRIVSDAAERRARWTDEDEAAEREECRRREASGARLVEDFRKRSAG